MRKVQTPILEVSNICKKTRRAQTEGVNISLQSGDCLVLLCRENSVCSLMIEILSGSVKPDKGKVFFKGDDVTGTKNCFGTVGREPSYSKRKNISDAASVPIVKRGLAKSMAQLLVKKELSSFGLEEYGDKSFGELENNLALRAELFAAYMCSHELIAIDEPFGTLSREERMSELKRLNDIRSSGRLSLLVFTQDIETAVTIGDTVMVTDNSLKPLGMIAVPKKGSEQAAKRIAELYE